MHVTGESTVADVLAMVDHTAKLGVKVIALPEYAFFAECILNPKEAAALADQTATNLSGVAAIAAKYGCLIAAPIVERAAAGLYVTTVLVGPTARRSAAIARPI